jgi:hypothetical protein
MGGKPSKQTPADKRLKENKPKKTNASKKPDENPDKPCSISKSGPVIRK